MRSFAMDRLHTLLTAYLVAATPSQSGCLEVQWEKVITSRPLGEEQSVVYHRIKNLNNKEFYIVS